MKNKNNLIALAVLLPIFLLIGCKKDKSTQPEGNLFGLLSSGDVTSLEEIKDDWDNGSLNGVIFLKKENNKIYEIFTINNVVDSSDYEGISYSANAGLFTSAFSGFDVNDFVINAFDMSRYSKGKYSNSKPDEFDTRFGTGVNRIEIDSNSLFNRLQDSVTLGQEISITNLDRGDTISKSTGFTLNWSESVSATKAFIRISHTNSFDPKILPDSVVSGASWYQDNSGSVDISHFLSNINVNGTFDLSVTLFEPHYLNLSNGNQILVIGESTHRISFLLTD